MKTNYASVIFLILLFIVSGNPVKSQKVRIITEDYKISRDSCKTHVYELCDYLKSKGLYAGTTYEKDVRGNLEWLKKSLKIGGNDFAKDYTFLIELKGATDGDDEDIAYGEFGIIEMGFRTEEKAKNVFLKAKEAYQKYPMNLPIYTPPYRCLRLGENVIFVYAILSDYNNFRNMSESWIPGKQ